jgi:transcriptional regulator with XRE-family HTH domain
LPTGDDRSATYFDSIAVGERLRAVRHLRRLTLVEVANKAELSESFVSQVERGRTNASIASLQRLAAAIGLTMADLFDPDGHPRARVLKAEERPVLAFGVLGKKFLLTPKPLQHLEVFSGELPPGGSTGEEPYSHGDSEEMFVVLSGHVHVQVGAELFDMGQRDSIVYQSSTPHRVVNVGDSDAEVLWIISPPGHKGLSSEGGVPRH